MTEAESTGPTQAPGAGGEIDWIAAERSPEFQDLVRKRRRFVIPATIFFLGWYSAFVLLAGYAPEFMGSSIYEGFTVGYALALTQFLMVWILGGLYLRKADRDFDPLARRAAAKAVEAGAASAAASAGTTGADGPSRSDGGHGAPATSEAPEARTASHAADTTSPDPRAGDGGQAPPGLRSSPTPGPTQPPQGGGEHS